MKKVVGVRGDIEKGTLQLFFLFTRYASISLCPSHSRAEPIIPMNEEWLTKVLFDTKALMMDIVISGVVGEEDLERVKG